MENIKPIIAYVVGFVHDKDGRFLLVRKEKGHPDLIGRLCGIGGKVEDYDFFPTSAMDREAKEEIGIEGLPWQTLGILQEENGFTAVVFHAPVEDLTKLPFKEVNDVGEINSIYTMEDVLWIEKQKPVFGLLPIMAHILYNDPTRDRIEIVRYTQEEWASQRYTQEEWASQET